MTVTMMVLVAAVDAEISQEGGRRSWWRRWREDENEDDKHDEGDAEMKQADKSSGTSSMCDNDGS